MFTYQLQARHFVTDHGRAFEFPNEVTIEVVLRPGAPFGVEDGIPHLTATQSTAARATWNANTGAHHVESEAPLNPINMTVEYDNLTFAVEGNVVRVTTACKTGAEFVSTVRSLHLGLPIVLNLDLADAPYLFTTRGMVGNVSFRWELSEIAMSFMTIDQGAQEQLVTNAIERLNLLSDTANARLIAALNYFHVACRLSQAGNGPWEFMAEAILNYAKVLQAVFGNDMDHVRQGLRALGYEDVDIEGDFIPMMVLRNHFDVGHVSIAIHRASDLDILHRYLAASTDRFRKLLVSLVGAMADESFTVEETQDLAMDPEQRRRVDRIVEILGPRNATPA